MLLRPDQIGRDAGAETWDVDKPYCVGDSLQSCGEWTQGTISDDVFCYFGIGRPVAVGSIISENFVSVTVGKCDLASTNAKGRAHVRFMEGEFAEIITDLIVIRLIPKDSGLKWLFRSH